MSADLANWALPRISRLLPLEDESLKEIVIYSASLSKEASAEHLKNLLGDSPQALEFISSFNARRANVTPPKVAQASARQSSGTQADQGVPRPLSNAQKKVKPPLHSAGPLRKPEGYGDVSGGYHKANRDEDYAKPGSRHGTSTTSLSDGLPHLQQSAGPQLLKVGQQSRTLSAPSSRDPSPPKARLPPSAFGILISDLPNVRSKQAKKSSHVKSGASTAHQQSMTTTTSSINDLTAAIAALELSTNPSLSSERRQCPCNASIHPLFTMAPNCLSCGKIICALEGLQPCSFCHSPILTSDEVSSMIRALKEERGQERMAAHNAAASGSGRGTPILGSRTPESGNSGDESSAAIRARAHRDKLLSFQRENAQRTRVHDEAADYDISLTPGTTQWMSPMQRAAALKKQQQYVREMEEANRPEYEKRKTIMSMSIKNGKLVRTYEIAKTQPKPGTERDDQELDENAQEKAETKSSRTVGQGAFSNNPLLASGKLIRPVWRGADEGKGKEKEEVKRTSVWRRVQDDNEDNERWILDGGTRGYEDRSK